MSDVIRLPDSARMTDYRWVTPPSCLISTSPCALVGMADCTLLVRLVLMHNLTVFGMGVIAWNFLHDHR